MADDSQDPFVPIVDEDGHVTGVMDQMTADFLASTESNPTQASLDRAFDGVTRIRLVGSRQELGPVVYDVVRVDVSDRHNLAELVAALRITEAEECGHLMAIGDHQLELWAGDQLVHTLELLFWKWIRWPSMWKGDTTLAEPRRFEEWLLGHGIADARDSREEDEQRTAESLRSTQNWEQAMPLSLRPLWPDRLSDGLGYMSRADLDAAEALLQAELPDPVARVQALYKWFGSGEGPWSGYPSYEGAAKRMLLAYSIEDLLAAVDASTDDPIPLCGAARLFAGWDFGKARKADRRRCPEPLVRRMLDAVIWHGNTDNLKRFRSAFHLPNP
jgi:hypothetical protein